VMEVRLAGQADARALAELRYAFRAEMAAPEEPEETFLERVTAWLTDRLEAGTWTAWAASASVQPVGLVLAHLVEKVPNPVAEPERLGYVSSLFVRPGWRGHGTGSRLLAAALDFCRRGGAETVVLWPSPRSVPLYRRHGFRTVGEVTELRLAPGLHPGGGRVVRQDFAARTGGRHRAQREPSPGPDTMSCIDKYAFRPDRRFRR
jgi:GNAT superfamily N-acetyltransferase